MHVAFRPVQVRSCLVYISVPVLINPTTYAILISFAGPHPPSPGFSDWKATAGTGKTMLRYGPAWFDLAFGPARPVKLRAMLCQP